MRTTPETVVNDISSALGIAGDLYYRQIIVVGGGAENRMLDNELKHGRRWNAENK